MGGKVAKQVRICLVASLLSLVVLSWSGCGPPPVSIQVTDQLGRVVGLAEAPQRIVSLDPGVTEILYALGLGDRVVGVSTGSDYPFEVQSKTYVGDASAIDMDTLSGLHPDLVVALTYSADAVIPQLEKKKIAVLALAPNNLDEMLDAISLVGEITGQQAAASDLVSSLRLRIKAVTDKTDAVPEEERPSVFYLYYTSPLVTAGAGTWENELIEKAGGINIAGGLEGYSSINLMTVVDDNPEVLMSMFQLRVGTELDPSYEFLTTNADLAETDARRDGRVWSMWDVMLNRAGPRLVDGLEEMQMLLYIIPAPNPSPSPSP